jgi:hypothetical protein
MRSTRLNLYTDRYEKAKCIQGPSVLTSIKKKGFFDRAESKWANRFFRKRRKPRAVEWCVGLV